MSFEWHDIVGTVGALLVIGAYLLLQLQKIQPTDISYPVCNGVGACLILISLSIDFNMAAFLIQIAWVVISGVGIVKGLLSSSSRLKDGRPN